MQGIVGFCKKRTGKKERRAAGRLQFCALVVGWRLKRANEILVEEGSNLMLGGTNKLLRESVALLRQAHETLRKDIAVREAVAKELGGRDHQKRLEEIRTEGDKNIREARERAERQRQEDQEYRQRLSKTLDSLNEVLSRIAAKLEQSPPVQGQQEK